MANQDSLIPGAADVNLPGGGSVNTGPFSGGRMGDAGIILAIGLVLALVLFVWAKYVRRSRHHGPAAADPPLRTGVRRKKIRSGHRPRNPTLAETGGLPPVREPSVSQPPPNQ